MYFMYNETHLTQHVSNGNKNMLPNLVDTFLQQIIIMKLVLQETVELLIFTVMHNVTDQRGNLIDELLLLSGALRKI